MKSLPKKKITIQHFEKPKLMMGDEVEGSGNGNEEKTAKRMHKITINMEQFNINNLHIKWNWGEKCVEIYAISGWDCKEKTMQNFTIHIYINVKMTYVSGMGDGTRTEVVMMMTKHIQDGV